MKSVRKRADDDRGSTNDGSIKKISSCKASSEIASSHDATSVTVTPNASSSMYSLISSFKYNNSDRPPFIIQVQPVDDSDVTSFHPLHISRILSQISPRDIIEIHKTGRSRVIAEMRNQEAANRLIANDQLVLHKLKAFIPTHRVLRTGIVRDVPQDFSLERLRESMTSTTKILEIYRLNRRTNVEGEIKYLPSRTICVKFAGQFLPHFVSICNYRYPVSPFIPKAQICFSCFRVGHMSKNCKSQPRCIYCGDGRHREEEECSLKSSPPICINCSGAHLPTSHECIMVIRHKMALSLASTENIPLAEAKKKVSNSSPDFLSKDLRFDYLNFPNLPRHQQSLSSSQPLRQSFDGPNRFSVLADLPSNFEDSFCRTFSSITAPSSRPNSHSVKQSFNPNLLPSRSPRCEDPRRNYLNYPNGRGPSGVGNGVALPTPTNSPFAPSEQSRQDPSPLLSSQGMNDLLSIVKKYFDDLIQPFYHAILERFSYLNVDPNSAHGLTGLPTQLSSVPSVVSVGPPEYPPLSSQP